ncbi:MAG TPA: R3H domain-containing nucleic acid-binding protein [Candidatus Nanoarchaeia archaeon]
MAKNSEKIATDFTKEVLKKIGMAAEVKVEEDEGSVKVSIFGENLGALIGYHGETLESLQLILGSVVNKRAAEGEWKRVVLDIGDWRAERLSTLGSMVEQAVEALVAQKLKRVSLPVMSSAQRREVHLIVSEKYPNLASQSEGEEPNRRVTLYEQER